MSMTLLTDDIILSTMKTVIQADDWLSTKMKTVTIGF